MIWQIVLFLCREASLMTMVVSGYSQSDTGDAKPENWSNSSIMLSLSVTLPTGSWVDESFMLAIMVSITSFTGGSVDIGFSCWLSDFFLKLYLPSIFPKKHFIVSIHTNISLPVPIGWDLWNGKVPIGNILLLLLLL